MELQSSTSEEDSGGGVPGNITSGDKTSGTASSLLTSMQKRSFDMTGNNKESGDNEGASFGRFRIERRNSKQHNGKLILDEGVSLCFLS